MSEFCVGQPVLYFPEEIILGPLVTGKNDTKGRMQYGFEGIIAGYAELTPLERGRAVLILGPWDNLVLMTHDRVVAFPDDALGQKAEPQP